MGKDENIEAAQEKFLIRLKKFNCASAQGYPERMRL